MELILKFVWVFGGFTMFLIVIPYLWMIKKLCGLLKERHQDVYNELGGLNLFFNNDIASSFHFTKYLLQKHYLRIDDTEVVRVFKELRFLKLSGFCVFGTCVIAAIGMSYF